MNQTVTVSFRLSPDDRDALEALAKKRKLDLSTFLRELAERELNQGNDPQQMALREIRDEVLGLRSDLLLSVEALLIATKAPSDWANGWVDKHLRSKQK